MRSVATRSVKIGSRLSIAMKMLSDTDCPIECIADIGCDHGFLSATLLQNNLVRSAYACDISPASVKKASSLAYELKLTDRLIVKQGDGLKGLEFLLDNKRRYGIAICGMGGELIARLLAEGESVARNASIIVMQPMRGESELRQYLHNNAYSITNERIALDDGRYYQLIAAKAGAVETIPDWFPKDYYRFGWVMAANREPLLLPLLHHYRGVYETELKSAKQKGRTPQKLFNELEAVDAIINWMEVKGKAV